MQQTERRKSARHCGKECGKYEDVDTERVAMAMREREGARERESARGMKEGEAEVINGEFQLRIHMLNGFDMLFSSSSGL